MKPKTRSDLLLHEVDDEAIVYDFTATKAHCLNRMALWVFRHADGRASVRALAKAASRDLGTPVGEPVILLALEELASANLLERKPVDEERRRALKKMAVGAGISLALPAVWSILAPRPAYAASTPCVVAHVCTPGSHECCGTPGAEAMACDGMGMCNANASQCMGTICR